MKKFLCIYFIAFIALNTYSQSASLKIDKNTVVKDSTGYIYPYAIWNVLLSKAEYTIKPINAKDKNTEFLLIRLSPKQIEERLERMPKPKESKYFITGNNIKLFKTSDINGKKINLKEKGRIIVFNFWFINCPPCRMEIPDLNELVDAYKGNDSVVFVGVALDKSSGLEDFLKRMPFKYSIIDDGRYIAEGYGIKTYPTHVVIDKESKVIFHASGIAPNMVYWLKKMIDQLLHPLPEIKN